MEYSRVATFMSNDTVRTWSSGAEVAATKVRRCSALPHQHVNIALLGQHHTQRLLQLSYQPQLAPWSYEGKCTCQRRTFPHGGISRSWQKHGSATWGRASGPARPSSPYRCPSAAVTLPSASRRGTPGRNLRLFVIASRHALVQKIAFVTM